VRKVVLSLVFIGTLAAACGGGSGGADAAGGGGRPGDAAPDAVDPNSLASVGLFDDVVSQTPAAGVIPYDVISVLFADRAEKLRFLSIPAGTRATYDPMDFWDYPDGTKFIKTFFYHRDARDPSLGRRLIETRIVEREAGTWTGRTYVWNDAQTEATRLKVGVTLSVSWIDPAGQNQTQDYRVPNDNECKTCHSKDHVFQPLGPRTRQLNRDHDYGAPGAPLVENQIDHLAALGLVSGTIPPPAERFTLSDPYGDAPLDDRARSYLDANCSHCHRPGGEAGSSALDLRQEITDPYALGTCRQPVAAGPGSGGHIYDVVPGSPDTSIMIFRVESTDPELKMPEVPTLTSDADGVALLHDWIAAMPPTGCGSP
jgi:uncharacterized repeat protein (TIGR03806 family)